MTPNPHHYTRLANHRTFSDGDSIGRAFVRVCLAMFVAALWSAWR